MALETWNDKKDIMSIPEYFAGQSIFITGGTGLMGKVLVEKILRSCPDVSKIYLLIREKKGVPIEERWNKITQLPLYEKLRSERPEALKKIFLVPGNIADEDMCLSEEHRKLIQENVTIVYHVAALIQFTDSITDALTQNVRGTLEMLELSKTIRNLKVFVHVSTAYCNINMPYEKSTEEVHPCCQDWKVLMKLLKTEPKALQSLKEKLLCGHPNPYTWSKSIGEQVVNEYRRFFPVIIIRPGVVSATVDDPIPAWNDTTNACFTMGAFVLLGLLRVFKGTGDSHQDLTPVDVGIKAMLITPWKLHVTGSQTTDVYNCCIASQQAFKYKEFHNIFEPFVKDFPSKNIIWPPGCYYVENPYLHYILFFFLQLVPGAILDLIFLLCKKQPVFTSLNKKIMNGYRVAGTIGSDKVKFPHQRFKDLTTYLKEEDLKDFGFTTIFSGEQKKEFLIKQAIGFFKYYQKEDMSEENIKKNRKRYERIKMVQTILKTGGELLVAWYLMSGVLWIISSGSYSFSSLFCKYKFVMIPILIN